MAIQRPNAYDDTARLQKVTDDLTRIKTVECPIFEVGKQESIGSWTFYWNYVPVSAPSATDAKSHGVTLTPSNPETEVQVTQYTEVNAKTWRVNTTDEAMAKKGGLIGRSSELANQELERREQLKYACEWSFLLGAGNAGANSPTAATTKGLITLAVEKGVNGTGTLSTWDTTGEASMNAHLVLLKAAGGLMGPKKLMYMSHTVKMLANKWKGIASAVNTMAPDQMIYNTVKVWDTDFGPIQLKGHDLCPSADVLTVNPDEIKVMVLENTVKKENAVGALFTEYAVSNQMGIKYKPTSTMGLMVISG